MADQFTSLGFAMDTPDALDRYFASAWPDKQLIDLDDGLYLRLDTAPGIQCWLSVSHEDQSLLDWELHFASARQCGVAFDADLVLDDEGQSGNIRMLLHPGEAEQAIVASVPALAFWPDREPGSPGLAQFACYAESLTLLPPDAAEALQASPDAPEAALTVRVISCESCVNSYSRRSFWHAVVTCCGSTMDLLLADELTPVPLPAGAMLHAACRVTAMVESGVTC